MDTRLITQVALLVAIVLLVGWDIYADVNRVAGDTISEVTLALVKTTPLAAVALGVILGHLVTAYETPDSGTISLWGQLVQWVKLRPVVPFLWGFLTGGMFWYQQVNFK
jgi:hypothetical protein